MICITHEIKNALEGDFSDLRLPPDIQAQRVRRVIDNELTEVQRDCLLMLLSGKRPCDIAEIRGVSRSTVTRTLKRTFCRLRRFLRY